MKTPAAPKRIVVAVTGASGAAYAVGLIRGLIDAAVEVHLVVSPFGRRLLADELGITEVSGPALIGAPGDRLIVHPYRDVGSVLGSGSFHTDGMVVCPCSSKTLASVASGVGESLVDRAAAVTLKERRRLILVHREMPLSHIDLLNAVRASEAGAVYCPASPGFYMAPRTVSDLVDFVVGRVLDLINVPHALRTRWADQRATHERPRAGETP